MFAKQFEDCSTVFMIRFHMVITFSQIEGFSTNAKYAFQFKGEAKKNVPSIYPRSTKATNTIPPLFHFLISNIVTFIYAKPHMA